MKNLLMSSVLAPTLVNSLAHQSRASIPCTPIKDAISTQVGPKDGHWSMWGAYVAGTAGLSSSVCLLIGDYRGTGPSRRVCAQVATAISSGVLIGLTASNNGQKSPAATSVPSKRDVSSLAQVLQAALDQSGVQYEAINDLTEKLLVQTSSTGPKVQSVIEFLGTKNSNAAVDDAEGDAKHDLRLVIFDDNSGHVQITPSPLNSTTLVKRHDGPGFKYNFYPKDSAEPLYHANQVDIANAFGQYFYGNANSNSPNQIIGFMEQDETEMSVFYYRLIPENAGFGDEYEDVNVCGEMAPDLSWGHDELKKRAQSVTL